MGMTSVDYTCSVADLYTAVAGRIYSTSHDLGLLRHCPAKKSIPLLPSWVPDWSTWTFGTLAVAHDAPYAASGTTSPRVRLHASPENRLELAGCLVDRLTHLSSPIGPHYRRVDPADTAERNKWLDEQTRFIQRRARKHNPSTATGGETAVQVLQRTLTGNLTLAGSIAKASHQAFFDTHMALTETSSTEETEMARKFIDAARRKSRSRRLALTAAETGFVCAVPEEAERGDWVVMFHGARSLFLVRERPTGGGKGRRFVLLGPAYVHGLMQGEGLRAEWYRERWISLV
ncbi:hypothetical protein B0T19DRAFT_86541 [Cercophora scortea]|uniref:Uncharacterized protein n=1 Tax=Cercophora scortea TaxID=314031 RepID=A0AAE0IVL1_9PEZI|nr:hypothetical protein B0T19DRAFT_86541 [Cercophora scortea]